MSKEKVIDINDLVQDSKNFNLGSEKGQQLIERSFGELGAGRSILVDKNGNIIAGNKSQKAAIAAGIKQARVIETDGTELVVVQRTDVDIDSAEGRRMALLDNLAGQISLQWDKEALESVAAEVEGFDYEEYMPEDIRAQIEAEEATAAAADERDNKEKPERQREPDSEIIVAAVSLFGTTEDMMLCQSLTKEEADKLIRLAKQEGAGNLMKRIIEAL